MKDTKSGIKSATNPQVLYILAVDTIKYNDEGYEWSEGYEILNINQQYTEIINLYNQTIERLCDSYKANYLYFDNMYDWYGEEREYIEALTDEQKQDYIKAQFIEEVRNHIYIFKVNLENNQITRAIIC